MTPRLAEALDGMGVREGDPFRVVCDELTQADRVLTEAAERALVERVAVAVGNAVLAAERERGAALGRKVAALRWWSVAQGVVLALVALAVAFK